VFAADNVRLQEKGVELAEALQKNAEANSMSVSSPRSR